MTAERSDLAKADPRQVEEIGVGEAAIEVWAGEYEGQKAVVLCATDRSGRIWVKAHVSPDQARVLSRAFAEAAGDFETTD